MDPKADLLLGKLIERTDNLTEQVRSLERTVDSHASRLETRISALEISDARTRGGAQMIMLLSAGAATIGGIVANFAAKIWPS